MISVWDFYPNCGATSGVKLIPMIFFYPFRKTRWFESCFITSVFSPQSLHDKISLPTYFSQMINYQQPVHHLLQRYLELCTFRCWSCFKEATEVHNPIQQVKMIITNRTTFLNQCHLISINNFISENLLSVLTTLPTKEISTFWYLASVGGGMYRDLYLQHTYLVCETEMQSLAPCEKFLVKITQNRVFLTT